MKTTLFLMTLMMTTLTGCFSSGVDVCSAIVKKNAPVRLYNEMKYGDIDYKACSHRYKSGEDEHEGVVTREHHEVTLKIVSKAELCETGEGVLKACDLNVKEAKCAAGLEVTFTLEVIANHKTGENEVEGTTYDSEQMRKTVKFVGCK